MAIVGRPSFFNSLIADIPYLCPCVWNCILFLLAKGILMSCHVKESHSCPSGHETERSFIHETISIPYSVPLFFLHFLHSKHLRLLFIPLPCASNVCSLQTLGQWTLFSSFNYIVLQWLQERFHLFLWTLETRSAFYCMLFSMFL